MAGKGHCLHLQLQCWRFTVTINNWSQLWVTEIVEYLKVWFFGFFFAVLSSLVKANNAFSLANCLGVTWFKFLHSKIMGVWAGVWRKLTGGNFKVSHSGAGDLKWKQLPCGGDWKGHYLGFDNLCTHLEVWLGSRPYQCTSVMEICLLFTLLNKF